jgi:hypothetical protein
MLPQTLVLDHVSPATRLLEKRRQMFEVQEALEAQKQEFNRKVREYFLVRPLLCSFPVPKAAQPGPRTKDTGLCIRCKSHATQCHVLQEEVFKRREEQLKLKDLELQESLIRFSKFLQENDSKRARAEKKAADEIKARLAKEKEIEQLSDVLEELRLEKERIHEVLEKNMR